MLSKPIKILIPIRYPVGGIRTYLKYTYKKLNPVRYQITIIGSSESWLQKIKSDLSEFNINIIIADKEENNLSLLRSLFKTIMQTKFDIIHSQGFTAGILSAFANVFRKTPHIITLHRIFGHDEFSSSFWRNNGYFKRVLIELILRKADIIQSVSDDAQANLLEYFPGFHNTRDKLRVIKNGVDIDSFCNVQENIYLQHSFERKEGCFYIGFFGRYMPEKGFKDLICIMNCFVNELNVNNIFIVSVGGFGGYIREYQKLIKLHNIGDQFIFLDFFNNIYPILNRIDILAIPSYSEACPLIPMEGLICGVPIIAYSCIGLREVLHSTPAIQIPVGNQQIFRDKILLSLSNIEKLKRDFMGYTSVAKKRFDSLNTSKQLELIFNNLLSSKKIPER